MKFTPFIAAAILAFTPIPTRAVPLTPATLNQTDVAAQSPGPIPLFVLPDGIVMPGAIEAPTGTTSTDLPVDSHSDNLEDFPHVVNNIDPATKTIVDFAGNNRHKAKATPTDRPHRYEEGSPNYHPWGNIGGHGPVVNPQPGEHKSSVAPNARQRRPSMRPGSPAGMDHGPVVHTGFQTITIAPKPTTTFSNLTGGPLTAPVIIPVHNQTGGGHSTSLPLIPFHRTPKGHHIGPRDLENSTTSANETSLQRAEEISKYVTCMNKPVNFTTLILYMEEVEEAIHHHLGNYTPSSNATSLIVKGLRFKMEDEFGTRLLDLQKAEMTRHRLCQAKHERQKHNETISPRSVDSTDIDGLERAWMAIEAQAIQVADQTSEMDLETIKTFDFHRFVDEIAQKLHGQPHANHSAVHNGTTHHSTGVVKLNFTATQDKFPELFNYKDHVIDANNITDLQTKEEVMRTIEDALESIENSDKFSVSNLTPAEMSEINKESNLNTRSALKSKHKPANATEAVILKQQHIDRKCRNNPFVYLSGECSRWRKEQNQKFYQDALKQAFPGLQILNEELTKEIALPEEN